MKLSFILASLLTIKVSGLEKSDNMDEPFQASTFKHLKHSACLGLYHRNGRAGCGTADRDTQSGALFYYSGQSSPPESNYVAVLEEYKFTSNVVGNLIANSGDYLQGILVLNGTISNSDEGGYVYSDMDKISSTGPLYPNGYNTPDANIAYGNVQYPWNGNGDGLNQYDLFGVPIAYVNEEGSSAFIRQASKTSELSSEIFTDFTYYMGPDGITSTECLAWEDENTGEWNPKCLPLGGVNVWGFAGSPPTTQVYKVEETDDGAEDDDAAEEEAVENDDGNNERKLKNVYQSEKNAIVVGASIDSTSMFHDLVPGTNEGASNTLTVLMAAYLIGSNVADATLDSLNRRIVFGFFEGEAFGYTGSRAFFNDVGNFECDNSYLVNSVANDENSDLACLYPMRPDMKFKDIGQIAGFLTVDQIGIPAEDDLLYVHNDGNGDIGTFMTNVLKQTGTDYFTVAESEAADQDNGDYPYPPTPFTGAQSISGGAFGGAVLTGYDYAYTKYPPYQTHLQPLDKVNLQAIASAATLVARTALAAAYDDGSFDYGSAAEFAEKMIPDLSYQDKTFKALADCLIANGNCQMLNKYASMEAENEKSRTGFDFSAGPSLGMPPNYYVGVYSIDNGQPFVRVGKEAYGSYDGDSYGEKGSDFVGMQPRMLQQAIRNLLHDFLGRGQMGNGKGVSCHKESDCGDVNYCATEGDSATCSAQHVCVCKRAYFHPALDTALTAVANEYPGKFSVDGDEENTPLWTEPYWSSNVGVKVYRDSKTGPGFIALGVGVLASLWVFTFTRKIKASLQKEKVY